MPTKPYIFKKFIVLLHRKVSKLVSNYQIKKKKNEKRR
nr:MAG TPA: hypothetical protein [Caudoviricetes sp.]